MIQDSYTKNPESATVSIYICQIEINIRGKVEIYDEKDTICPTQVVTMAKRERIVPTKLS